MSRCVAALMAALVAFQLCLVGSGMACTMPVRGAELSMGRTAPVVASVSHHAPSALDGGMARMPKQMPCHEQGSVPMCQAMGPCVTALVGAPIRAIPVRVSPPSRVVALIVLTPPSQTFPPELPPPRA
jgi:hypothetical protein